jgi:hypothetical protein
MNRRLLLSTLFLIGALNGSAHLTTYALWTTSLTSTNNQFSAGTLHIAHSLAAGTTLSMTNLLAGDYFDRQIDINNSGSLRLRYSLTTTTSGDATLASTLQLGVRTKTSNPCSDHDGINLYAGNLATAAFGNPASGSDVGDRELAAGAIETLCFEIVLPSGAPASLLATTFAPTFVFSAEQV